jgi:hypothetical protein
MADDMEAVDKLLWEGWSDFCEELKEAGRLIFNHEGPANAQNRAAGFEYLARYIPKALDLNFNHRDTDHPQLFWFETPTSKSFGDNPDCTYLAGWLDGGRTYRLVGNRGTVKWVSILVRGGKAINNRDLLTNWDGSFEVILSAKEHPGNWIPLEPGPHRIQIRQFFGSWHEEEPMRVRIECLDVDTPPPPPTPTDVADRLHETISWLREDTEWWSRFVSYFRQFPNQFVRRLPDFYTTDAFMGALGRTLLFCHWDVEHDEALMVTVRPPQCAYWNFELGNEWMNSVDYRYRLSSLNSVQAEMNPDGTLVLVLSHQDPGIANWLDLAGYTSGQMNQRWVEADGSPLPEARLVKFADLERELPAGTPRVDGAWRREQLRLRKVGVDRRFPT